MFRISGRLLSLLVVLGVVGCSRPVKGPTAHTIPQFCTLDHGGVIRGDPSQRSVALIFTGGEHGEGTPTILDALRQRGLHASFFVTGQYIRTPEFEPWLRRMADEGHYLGPHSDAHLLYCDWEDRSRTLVTEEEFKRDLTANIDALRLYVTFPDHGPIYFIPPYEWFNEDQVRWAKDLSVVLFNFTPGTGSNRDWAPEGHRSFVPSETIVRDILEYEQRDPQGLNGFFMLLHLGSLRKDKMHPHIGGLLDALQARGYRFVRINEMLEPRPVRAGQ